MPSYSNTTKYALRRFLGSNLVSDIDAGFAALADDADAAFAGYAEGTLAGIPAAAKAGRLYRATDTGQVFMDSGSAWINLGVAPALVSSLPGSPFDGQEIYYSADPTNGVIWHLRYRSASASAYKWESTGGGVLSAEVAAYEALGSTGSYIDLATVGPTITVPLAGDYEVSFGCEMNFGSAHQTFTAPKFGAAATLDADSLQMSLGNWITMSRAIRRNVSAAAQVVKLQYKTNSAGNTIGKRGLMLRPIRVG